MVLFALPYGIGLIREIHLIVKKKSFILQDIKKVCIFAQLDGPANHDYD